MAFAIDTYTGNGSTTTFSVTFPYIEKAHVIVTVDGVTKTLTTDYTFPTSSTITFNSAPSANAVIKFTRSSNRTARLVDYQDGSTLTEATLDQDGNQSFFMAQEAIDTTENTIGLTGSDEKNIIKSYWPRAGRVVLFDARIPHVARAVETDKFRVSLVFKGTTQGYEANKVGA